MEKNTNELKEKIELLKRKWAGLDEQKKDIGTPAKDRRPNGIPTKEKKEKE